MSWFMSNHLSLKYFAAFFIWNYQNFTWKLFAAKNIIKELYYFYDIIIMKCIITVRIDEEESL